MTNLLYLSQMRLPTEKAHGLQMMDIAFVLSDEADYLRGGVRTR